MPDKKYSIKASTSIQTTLAGVKYNNCEDMIINNIRKGSLKKGSQLLLIPDPENKFDRTATRVCMPDGSMIGWLPNKEWNDKIFKDLISGKKWEATVNEIFQPSKEFGSYNLLIDLWEYFDKDEYINY